jgi:5-methylcytosine-specific restriction endonuclease McrA
MGKWIHVITLINGDGTGRCRECGDVRLSYNNRCRNSVDRWKNITGNGNPLRGTGRRYYKKYREDKCSRCGFVPEDECQLDVDHIDGNHSNNDPSNLQTLCANCHRLKTKQERRTPPT